MVGFKYTLNDFPFLEYYRIHGQLPLETQSFYQNAYETIRNNKLDEKFKGAQNKNTVKQMLENKRFEVKFLSDSLKELKSIRFKEIQKYPDREIYLKNIYLDVERDLLDWIDQAKIKIKEYSSIVTSPNTEVVDKIYDGLKHSFIKSSRKAFRGIFGIEKFEKSIVWIKSEALLVYFIDELCKRDFITDKDQGKIHVKTAHWFIKEDSKSYYPKQLAKTKNYYIRSGREPMNSKRIKSIFDNLDDI